MTGALDCGENLVAECAALDVGTRRRQLHHRERADQVGVEPQLDAGDVKVLERPRAV
jgi:hypothetical protein